MRADLLWSALHLIDLFSQVPLQLGDLGLDRELALNALLELLLLSLSLALRLCSVLPQQRPMPLDFSLR